MERNHPIGTGTGLLISNPTFSIPSNCTFYDSKYRHLIISGLIILLVLTGFFSAETQAEPGKPSRLDFDNGNVPSHASSKHGNPELFARGRILVAPRAGLPAQAFANMLAEHDGKARKIGQSNLYIVNVPEYAEEGIVERLKHHPHLKFATLDHAVAPAFTPDDPYYPSAWHLPKIGAPIAWNNAQGSGVIIAIVDSGTNSQHPDLAGQLVPGWNVWDDIADTTDLYGHGTRVSGSAAAAMNNGIGVSGIASQASIMPVKVTPESYGGTYYSYLAKGLVYAADHGARIANVSFDNTTSDAGTRNAAEYMKSKNGLVIVGAGNTGVYENRIATSAMIPVSATEQNDLQTGFSSSGEYVAMSAPGQSIWTTDLDGGYSPHNGTSHSSPITAGVVALMMSANPTLSNLEIENLLYSTAVDLGEPGRDPVYGYGRVDAAAAVQAAIEAVPMVDTKAPTALIVDPLDGATVTGLVPVDIAAADNVGVSRVELWVNNTAIAVDSSTPYAFTWDSNGAPDGLTRMEARVFDATGNMTSSSVEVNVDNVPEPLPSTTDTEPPVALITNPVAGNVTGNVTISTDATDNYGASGITQSIYIDGSLVATGTGSTLAYSWNTRPKRVNAGKHTITVVANDAAGNSTSTSVIVNVMK